MPLSANRWGKSEVRVSKVHHGPEDHEFSDVTVQVLLEGDVAAAHTTGDNRGVLPTDTIKNTVYGLAHAHLTKDLEGFGEVLCERFLGHESVTTAIVRLSERIWARETEHGFMGGGSERRVAKVARGERSETSAGIEGLVMLKTTGSAFVGFPRDEFTILPEAEDRILGTSLSADWAYTRMPADTSTTWALVRSTLVERFFSDVSASMQHQGYFMGEAVLGTVAEISEITLQLPNQHHLPFDVTRFGVVDTGTVFQPVSEPYGDIQLTVTRESSAGPG